MIMPQYTEAKPRMFMRMGVGRGIVMCKVKAKGKEFSSPGGPVTEIIKPVVTVLMNLLKQMAVPYN